MDCITKNSTKWGGLHINTSLFHFIPQFFLIVKLTTFFFSLQITQQLSIYNWKRSSLNSVLINHEHPITHCSLFWKPKTSWFKYHPACNYLYFHSVFCFFFGMSVLVALQDFSLSRHCQVHKFAHAGVRKPRFQWSNYTLSRYLTFLSFIRVIWCVIFDAMKMKYYKLLSP